jgi:hypothetical protein
MLTKRQAGKAGLTDKEEDAVVAFPRTYMDAPILPRAQSMLKRGKVAVVHSAYLCSILLLALMESAGWLLNRLHALSECCVRQGFASHGLDLFRHHRMCA